MMKVIFCNELFLAFHSNTRFTGKKDAARAMSLLATLTSKEVADEAFEAIMHNEKQKRVGSIKPESTSKLSKSLHLDPLAWLLEREVFEPKLATGLQDVLAQYFEGVARQERKRSR